MAYALSLKSLVAAGHGRRRLVAVWAEGGSWGVYATGTSYGVVGKSAKEGVRGEGDPGVYGYSTTNDGVLGRGPNRGVHGIGGAYGVFGQSSQQGVTGLSEKYGVVGYSSGNTGDYAGIYGRNTSTGFAGYFLGKVHVQGAFSYGSDRNMKTNFAPVSSRQILDTLSSLPVTTWNYTTEGAGVRHLGPMAQDFRAAFGLGADDTSIGAVDANGVALAAIQGLYQMMVEKDKLIAELQARVAQLERNASK